MPVPLLEIRAARRTFHNTRGPQFRGPGRIDLRVEDGEFVTLLGPSGCGKTTLLRAIAGFEQIDDGVIRLDGADIGPLPPHRRPVNTVFQSYALFPHMSVGRNVGYALEVRGVPKAAREAAVAEALSKVGLGEYGGRRPAQLSGGQRQRVALARAIVAQPRLLLLDEPLSALDRNLRQQMQIELKDLQNRLGIAFVFVTHDQEEALTMSDRIVVMRAGRIEQAGPPREIFRAPKTRFVAEFIGETNLFPAVVNAAGDLVLEGAAPARTRGRVCTGSKVIAVLRPTDLAPAAQGLAGTVSRVIYLGADLHLRVMPEGGGSEIGVILRDAGAVPAAGERVVLGYDAERVHVMAAAA